MNPNDDTKDEEQIAAILSSTTNDAAPPDADVLARLRAQSTAAFAATENAAAVRSSSRAIRMKRVRWLGAAAAVLFVVSGLGVYFWLVPGPHGVSFGQVLENMEKADTMHMLVTRGKKQTEIWLVSKPWRSRWDDLDGNYRIADGAKYWIVNEKANEARARSAGRRGSDQFEDPCSIFWDLCRQRGCVFSGKRFPSSGFGTAT